MILPEIGHVVSSGHRDTSDGKRRQFYKSMVAMGPNGVKILRLEVSMMEMCLLCQTYYMGEHRGFVCRPKGWKWA